MPPLPSQLSIAAVAKNKTKWSLRTKAKTKVWRSLLKPWSKTFINPKIILASHVHFRWGKRPFVHTVYSGDVKQLEQILNSTNKYIYRT